MIKSFVRTVFRWPEFRHLRRMVFAINGPADLAQVCPAHAISLVPVTEYSVALVGAFRGEEKVVVFRQYLHDGQRGVYALDGRDVVGHAWAIICRERKFMANGYFRLRKNDALIHFCRVRKSHRGRSIYPMMLVSLCKRLFAEEGVHRVFVDTEQSNVASIRGLLKAGFKPLWRASYVNYRSRLIFKRQRPLSPAILEQTVNNGGRSNVCQGKLDD